LCAPWPRATCGSRLTHRTCSASTCSFSQRPDPAFGTPGKWSQHLNVPNNDDPGTKSPKSPVGKSPKVATGVPLSPLSPKIRSAPSSPHVPSEEQASGRSSFALDGKREQTLRSRGPPTALSMLKNSKQARPPTLVIANHENRGSVFSRSPLSGGTLSCDESKQTSPAKKKAL